MYVVVVEFEIQEVSREIFLSLMRQNAETSVSVEPGCKQFDVSIDPKKATSVFLYEVYTDRQAFDDHLVTPHFKSFDSQTAQMIERKNIRTLDLIYP